jgi:hypothetical protein
MVIIIQQNYTDENDMDFNFLWQAIQKMENIFCFASSNHSYYFINCDVT